MKTLTDMIKKCLCIAISVAFTQLPEAQILVSNTFAGGTNNAGTIGKYSGDTKQLTVLESLGGPGTAPACGLTQANDGKLYGMTVTGGVNNFGGIFSFDPASGTYTDLKSLADLDGRYPTGSLLQASDGRLYATTNGGSGDNNGILFSFDPASSTCTNSSAPA